jgi:hypothetical protein
MSALSWLKPATLAATVIVAGTFLGGSAAALAATPDQAPPLTASQSRVWFLRELLPGTSYHPPMVYVNGTPIAVSAEGKAWSKGLEFAACERRSSWRDTERAGDTTP